MKVEVYKSEHTGELFESKKEYDTHLRDVKKQEKSNKNRSELIKNTNEILEQPRLTATSIEDFRKKALKAINKCRGEDSHKLLGLFFDIRGFSFIGNTHSSPVDGVQNWGRDDDSPKGYMGWGGGITIIYSDEGSNTCDGRNKIERLVSGITGFYTGSGGYRGKEHNGIKGYVLQYGLSMYIDDFPLIKAKHETLLQLQESYNVWDELVMSKIETKNSSDKYILSNNENLDKLKAEITIQKEKETVLVHKIWDRQKKNSDSILKANPFKELKERDSLKKLLMIR